MRNIVKKVNLGVKLLKKQLKNLKLILNGIRKALRLSKKKKKNELINKIYNYYIYEYVKFYKPNIESD